MTKLLSITACLFALTMANKADAQAPNPAREQQIRLQLVELRKQAAELTRFSNVNNSTGSVTKNTSKKNVITIPNLPPGSYSQTYKGQPAPAPQPTQMSPEAAKVFAQIRALEHELLVLERARANAKGSKK